MKPVRLDPPQPPEPPRRGWHPLAIYGALGLAFVLFFVFPVALRLFEAAARQLRFLIWIVLLLALLLWLGAVLRKWRK